MTQPNIELTYRVWTLTPKGNYSLKYDGTIEDAALKAYGKLIDKKLPRLLTRGKTNGLMEGVMSSPEFVK